MSKLDLKKAMKHLYGPSSQEICELEVPPLNYVMIDGEGDPNGEAFNAAVTALYTVSYGLRAAVKQRLGIEYSVMPLEGLWWTKEGRPFDIRKKCDLCWTVMIAQPEQVTRALFEEVLPQLKKKKKDVPELARVRFEPFTEGRVLQVLHVGHYDDEPATLGRLQTYASERGFCEAGKHHEIYLSNPQKTPPTKLKTILRQPVASSS